MKCPHCPITIHPDFEESHIGPTGVANAVIGGLYWSATHMTCPACKQAIISIGANKPDGTIGVKRHLVFPRSSGRKKAAPEVPQNLAEDYHEACLVLSDSPKASAALSRRCLQALLRENGFAQKDLAPAIDAVLASKQLPTAIAENLDAVRNIGNFAAHPMKDTNSGEVVPVEPEEAEWNLDVLDELFDFYYVQPARARQKRQALDAKLVSAGKPPMKQ